MTPTARTARRKSAADSRPSESFTLICMYIYIYI